MILGYISQQLVGFEPFLSDTQQPHSIELYADAHALEILPIIMAQIDLVPFNSMWLFHGIVIAYYLGMTVSFKI